MNNFRIKYRIVCIGFILLFNEFYTSDLISQSRESLDEGKEWFSRAKELSSTYLQSDSIYIYYNLAKERFSHFEEDSLLYFCNSGLIEWQRRYGDDVAVLQLLNENKQLVHDDLSHAILLLDYCSYYSIATNYNSDSIRYYAQLAVDVTTQSNDTVQYIVANQHLALEYLKDPTMLDKVPIICKEILDLKDHNHITQSLAVQTEIDLTDYFIQVGEAHKAIPILTGYTNSSENYDVGFRIWINEYLEKAYVQLGDYHNAHNVSNHLTKLVAEQADKEREQSLREMEVVYQLQRTEQELKATQQIATANELRVNTQRLFIYSLLIGGLAIISLVWLAWYNQKKKAIANLELAETQKEVVSMKNTFFDNIAHEIRTPLTIIKGMSQRIKEMPKEKELIARNTNHILSLVDQVLDLSKSDQGLLKLYPKVCDIIPLLQEEINDHQSLALEKSINLSFISEMDSYSMNIDDQRLKQICTNLISNGIKYTPEHGSVSLMLDIVEDGIIIKCKDSGIGISEDEIEQIFNRFYRANKQYASGTGIGLSVVKELVDLMGGEIEVSSQVDIGSQFTVYLPNT